MHIKIAYNIWYCGVLRGVRAWPVGGEWGGASAGRDGWSDRCVALRWGGVLSKGLRERLGLDYIIILVLQQNFPCPLIDNI